jgi:hypothetical protein
VRFDEIARSFLSPDNIDVTAFRLRWAALKLRKEAKFARSRAYLLGKKKGKQLGHWSPPTSVRKSDWSLIPETAGLYVVQTAGEVIYVGEALNLGRRLSLQFSRACLPAWKQEATSGVEVKTILAKGEAKDLLAYQSHFVAQYNPRLNFEELAAV